MLPVGLLPRAGFVVFEAVEAVVLGRGGCVFNLWNLALAIATKASAAV